MQHSQLKRRQVLPASTGLLVRPLINPCRGCTRLSEGQLCEQQVCCTSNAPGAGAPMQCTGRHQTGLLCMKLCDACSSLHAHNRRTHSSWGLTLKPSMIPALFTIPSAGTSKPSQPVQTDQQPVTHHKSVNSPMPCGKCWLICCEAACTFQALVRICCMQSTCTCSGTSRLP